MFPQLTVASGDSFTFQLGKGTGAWVAMMKGSWLAVLIVQGKQQWPRCLVKCSDIE